MTFELKKVFDSKNLRASLWNSVSLEQANDSYNSWTVGGEHYGLSDTETAEVSAWLIEQGAEPGEKVLIWISW